MRIPFLILVNLAIFVALPVYLIMYFKQPSSWRVKSKGGGAVGNALQELDRLIARPSIEYRQEVADSQQAREDDKGGE